MGAKLAAHILLQTAEEKKKLSSIGPKIKAKAKEMWEFKYRKLGAPKKSVPIGAKKNNIFTLRYRNMGKKK